MFWFCFSLYCCTVCCITVYVKERDMHVVNSHSLNRHGQYEVRDVYFLMHKAIRLYYTRVHIIFLSCQPGPVLLFKFDSKWHFKPVQVTPKWNNGIERNRAINESFLIRRSICLLPSCGEPSLVVWHHPQPHVCQITFLLNRPIKRLIALTKTRRHMGGFPSYRNQQD